MLRRLHYTCKFDRRSIPHRDAGLNRPRRHPVILGITQLAFRDRIATVGKIPPVESPLPAARPIADSGIEGRERRRESGIALVQEAITRVVEDNVARES